MRALLLTLAVSTAALAQVDQPWTRQWDELWKRRDQPGVEKQLGQMVRAERDRDPNGFDAAWRAAALLDWQADGFQGELKGAVGKAAWQAADKAIQANPDDVHGQYYGGVGIGLYSEGVGVLTALSEGLEGKFRDRLLAALRIDKDFLDGAPQVVWGRYFYKLPWPKRDLGKSIEVLTACVKSHPTNLRAKLYLADALVDDGKGAEARKLAQAVLDAPPGVDGPDDRRLRNLARKWIAEH